MQRNRVFFSLTMTCAILLLSVQTIFAAEFSLKYAHVQPDTHVTNRSALWLADQLKKETNGRIELKVFPSGVLGRDNEMLDGLEAGDIDIAWISSANLGTSITEFNVFSLPYLFSSDAHYNKVFAKSSPVMQLLATYVDKSPYGIVLGGMLGGVSRQAFNNYRPIVKPEDLKGLKIRVQNSPVEMKVWTQLGAAPQQLAWTEIYTSLQTSVVHAAEASIDAYFQNKFFEVSKYLSLTNHQYMALPILIGKKTLKKLPDDLRATLVRLTEESGIHGIGLYQGDQAELLKTKVPEFNVQLNEAQTGLFKAKVADLIAEESKKYGGGDILTLIDAVK
ncbi:putative TRAP dicarboxylate transporter-DctP subunit [uncultured delta proteobacterium]|uniref:Putative TRAP dicarboxylate transporter-DctP subunit n=1 Tax=uncultured delta proteobacterium TaxID=34034 RepID=A0A212K2V7_9DELT|nr:putative TRAP dicarboxylate transporter-DctP subunit [uncultured delta proteobacterium]